ncbi:MDR family MFS transporter [Kurthia sibirica]|uniref:MFS-type drug efflux transporter P55 n=1 Tax=Kurthia sibirica TaxID=202750 RepID=A0A2U3ALL0_9BACL|nr:MDR family MFS transporter [Kurthia sibirica]PWI25397.1 MFS transporter [Kurthia sibirica]GEK35639.1 MFS transporter [Kurthia sibirica]
MNKVFIAVLLATALSAIEGTIVATAIPSITADLSGVELISWIYSAYLLAAAIATILFGKLADIFGRKRMIIIGLSIFILGSLLAGLAQSMIMLIIFRAIQGFGAGSILPITLTIVGEIFKTEKRRAKGQGYISMVWGVSGVVGPLIGGYLVDSLSWHYIFLLNVPFGLGSLFLLLKYYKENHQQTKHTIDYRGAVLFSISTVAFLLAIIEGSNSGEWFATLNLICYVITIVGLMLFIRTEMIAKEPIIPLTLFKNRRLNIVNALTFMFMSITIAVTVYIPIYGQSVLGHSATKAGLLITPLSFMWTVSAIIVGNLVGRIANKIIIQCGTLFLVIGTVMLTFLQVDSTSLYVCLSTGILGMGMGLIAPLIIITVQASAKPNEIGISIGLNSFTNTFSQAVGAAIFGVLFNIMTSQQMKDLDKGEIQLTGSFDESIFSQVEISKLVTIISEGTSVVYIGAAVFAVIAFILAAMLQRKNQKTV